MPTGRARHSVRALSISSAKHALRCERRSKDSFTFLQELGSRLRFLNMRTFYILAGQFFSIRAIRVIRGSNRC